MNTCRSASFISLLLLTFAFGFVSIAARADQSLSRANEQKAREHYLAGETAMKSGDALTAVVEWESALRLKPSSAYTAKQLSAAAAKLGDDGAEAYAHYLDASQLQDQGKLDDAGKELGFALAYHPKSGLTPRCLTDKALELANLQTAAAKPVETAKPKADSSTANKTTSTTKSATSTDKKTTSKSTTTKSTASSSKPKTSSKPKIPKQPAYRMPTPRQTKGRLSYVHSITVNGHKVPAHYTYRNPRPVKLPPPP